MIDNGIEFILRDRAGYTPDIKPPRSRFRWANPRPEIISKDEQAFIRDRRGKLSIRDLAHCYGVSYTVILSIQNNPNHVPADPRLTAHNRRKAQARKLSEQQAHR